MKTILLLGGAGIHGPEGTITGRGPRARMALLGVLATSRGRIASRERLAALLWPDNDTDRARHLLREAVYRLREQLGEAALVSAGDEIRVDEGAVGCDVWQFERAVSQGNWLEADRFYRGPFLDGLVIGGSAGFEQWLDAERARLAGLHARAIESLATELTARGEWDGALGLWKRRAAGDPYNSRVALQIMAALDAAGDRGGALRHAVLHAELLATELGAAPDPDVAAFAERLRREPVPRERSHPGNGNGTGNGSVPATFAGTSSGNGNPLARTLSLAATGHGISHGEPESVSTVHREPATTLSSWRRRPGSLVALGASVLLTAGFVGMRAFRSDPALDPNRIAILPVQTSGADSTIGFLRDGLVWALAAHFTGDVGPVAVDPGEALAAWNRSGMGATMHAREALRIARELRAGQVTYAALLGTPQRFTVQIQVLNVADGSVRIAPVEVEGSRDEWPALVARIAARLKAPYVDASLGTLASVNQEAMRLYVEGMGAYRRGSWADAGTRLFGAFQIDSTFVPAALRFALLQALVVPMVPLDTVPSRFLAPDTTLGPGGPEWRAATWLYRNLWDQRHRLPNDQRQLVESIVDGRNIRWHQEQLPALEKAVRLHERSAEAWQLLGDAYYHAGALLGRTDWVTRSKGAFERAWLLDSVVSVKAAGHLADIAFIERDARSYEHYSRLAAGVAWPWENPTGNAMARPRGANYRRYQAAILSGVPAALHAARNEYSRAWARGEEAGADWAISGMTIPPVELNSLLAQMKLDATSDADRQDVDIWLSHAWAMSGRRGLAMEALRRSTLDWVEPDTLRYFTTQMAWAEHDSAAAEEIISIARERVLLCNAALSRLRRGDTTGVASIIAAEPGLQDALDVISAWQTAYRRGPRAQRALCALIARGVLASLTTGGVAGLYRADSLMRVMPLNYADWWNYDLALALARRGEYALAVAAVRRHFHDTFPQQRLVLRLRQEGRWAAMAGDTAAAINALKQYLVWRSNPDPSLIPQRDSVKAELAALERRTWRSVFRWIASKH